MIGKCSSDALDIAFWSSLSSSANLSLGCSVRVKGEVGTISGCRQYGLKSVFYFLEVKRNINTFPISINLEQCLGILIGYNIFLEYRHFNHNFDSNPEQLTSNCFLLRSVRLRTFLPLRCPMFIGGVT